MRGDEGTSFFKLLLEGETRVPIVGGFERLLYSDMAKLKEEPPSSETKSVEGDRTSGPDVCKFESQVVYPGYVV